MIKPIRKTCLVVQSVLNYSMDEQATEPPRNFHPQKLTQASQVKDKDRLIWKGIDNNF